MQCSACTRKHTIQRYKNCCIQLCTNLEALGHVVRKHPFIVSRSVYCKSRYSHQDTDNIALSPGRSSISGSGLEKKKKLIRNMPINVYDNFSISVTLRTRHLAEHLQFNNSSLLTVQSSYEKFVCFWHGIPLWVRASTFTRFLDHTQRRTTVGRTPLDE